MPSWKDRDLWDKLSPLNTIHRATTPILFYGGESDWNVPIQGSEQLYQVMRRAGVETQLVVYPDDHHGGWTFPNESENMPWWFPCKIISVELESFAAKGGNVSVGAQGVGLNSFGAGEVSWSWLRARVPRRATVSASFL